MVKRVLFFMGALALGLFLFAPSATAVGTPVGTVIENQAFADYADANGNPLPRVYSNTVTTTVSQVAGVSVTPETDFKEGIAGAKAYHGVSITNTGNGPDTIDLALSVNTWTSVIYLDANGDGIWDEGTETTVVTDTGVLAADTSYYVVVVVDVPSDAADGASDSVVLTATSQFDGGVTDSGTYTTTAESAVFQVNKYVLDTPENPKPGDTITYKITGENIGSTGAEAIRAEDYIPAGTTYVPNSMRIGDVTHGYGDATPVTDANDGNEGGSDIGAYFDGTKVVYTKDSFGAGEKGAFFFQVTVNAGVLENTDITNHLTAYYKHIGVETEYTATSNTTSTVVGFLAAVDLDPDRTGTGNPGDEIVYPFTATNNGNAADRINITTNSTGGWTWVIWADVDGDGTPGTDGDYILTDTDSDGVIDTGVLTPNGGSLTLLAVSTIPVGTVDGSVGIMTVTGNSTRDPGVSDSITLTTTVTAPVLTISKTVSPEGPQPPGTVLTYTITVTNIGTGTATSIVIADTVPEYTTYVEGSLKTGTSLADLHPRTDSQDGDGASYISASHSVVTDPATRGPGGIRMLQFQVTID
jgi:trimeric autotransporter adhesin